MIELPAYVPGTDCIIWLEMTGIIYTISTTGKLISEQRLQTTPLAVISDISEHSSLFVNTTGGLIYEKDGREVWRNDTIPALQGLDTHLFSRTKLLSQLPKSVTTQSSLFMIDDTTLRAININDGSQQWHSPTKHLQQVSENVNVRRRIQPTLFNLGAKKQIVYLGYPLHRGRLHTWSPLAAWQNNVHIPGWDIASGRQVSALSLLNDSTIYYQGVPVSIIRSKGWIQAHSRTGKPKWIVTIPKHHLDVKGSRSPINLTTSHGPILIQDWSGGLITYEPESQQWRRWWHGHDQPQLAAAGDIFGWTHGMVSAIRSRSGKPIQKTTTHDKAWSLF